MDSKNQKLKIKNFQNFNLFVPTIIVLLAALMRLLPHPANVAPIAAMALFGGCYLNKKVAFVLPIAAMLVSDLYLGFDVTTPFVYSSFILSIMIGFWLQTHQKPYFIVSASLLSSILFFLITNFGVWLVGGLYQHNLNGLINCYVLAIPFFRNTVAGDLFYTIVLFGCYAFLLKGRGAASEIVRSSFAWRASRRNVVAPRNRE